MKANIKNKIFETIKDKDTVDQFMEILNLPNNQFDNIYDKMVKAIEIQFENPLTKKRMIEELSTMPYTDIKGEIAAVDSLIEDIKTEDLSENKKNFLILMINKSKDLLLSAIKNPREEIPVSIVRIHPDAILPTYAHEADAGADIYAVEDTEIKPRETKIVATGIKVGIPAGYEIQIRPRSGMSAKTKIRICNTPGTIDSGYLGEVGIIMENTGFESYTICKGDKIAQMIIQSVPMIKWKEVEELESSERGENGYGSTDKS